MEAAHLNTPFVVLKGSSVYTFLLKSEVLKKEPDNMNNPLVPRVQKIKIHSLTLNRFVIVEFVKKNG